MKMGLCLFLSSLILNGICLILAAGVSTPQSLEVEKGKELRMDCILKYHVNTQLHNIKLDWSYARNSDSEEDLIFFHYQNLSVVVQNSTFFQRLQWVGDIQKFNGSILITEVECDDSGYFTCDMRIPRVSSRIFQSKIHLKVSCIDPRRPRIEISGIHELPTEIPKNMIIYATVGILAFFIALSITLVSVWKKCSRNTASRSQRNYPDRLEDSEDTNRYVTVTSTHPRQTVRETKAKKGKKTKKSKTGEEEIYVTMDTNRYVTVSSTHPRQTAREDKAKKGKKTKKSKSGEEAIYVAMHSFVESPRSITLTDPISGERG
ncbi:uncharacterized protein LOC144480041 [Mustelus asterias]